MAGEDSVTQWIAGVRTGSDEAIGRFVDRYYEPIVRLVQQRLPPVARRGGDGEDVALSALDSFVARARHGEFPQLENRDDLWRILVTISKRKAAKHIAHETAQKRGGGKIRGESVFQQLDGPAPNGLEDFPERTDSSGDSANLLECAAEILEFLDSLGDETMRRIAIWKSHGLSDEQISQELNCSVRTVERKRRRLRDKADQWATHLN